MYKYNSSIILINSKVSNQDQFLFEPVPLSNIVKKDIKDISPNKSSTWRYDTKQE